MPSPPNVPSGMQVWENNMFPLGNYQLNTYPQTNWSEDHWPAEGRSFLGNDQRYNGEPRYSHDQRYSENNRGTGSFGRGPNNILSEAFRQKAIIDNLKRNRYAPY